MHEAGIPFELERVDNKAKTTKSGENFWDVNPKGVVPVLKLDDGQNADRSRHDPALSRR